MIWVAATNTNLCRIYQYDKQHSRLSLLIEINHPEIKLKNHEFFESDKPGKYKSNSSARGAFTQETDPKKVEIEQFSREIADELDKGRKTNRFQKLIIISEPHMHGLLSQHLSKHTKNLIINHIQKNIQHLPEHELIQFLKTHTQYPD